VVRVSTLEPDDLLRIARDNVTPELTPAERGQSCTLLLNDAQHPRVTGRKPHCDPCDCFLTVVLAADSILEGKASGRSGARPGGSS